MKYAETFSSIYVLSGCCLSAAMTPGKMQAESIHSQEEAAKAGRGVLTTLAEAAWSPDPQNSPFYFDLPTNEGEPQPAVIANWAANAPPAMRSVQPQPAQTARDRH
jgi:hypothetical protein